MGGSAKPPKAAEPTAAELKAKADQEAELVKQQAAAAAAEVEKKRQDAAQRRRGVGLNSFTKTGESGLSKLLGA